MNKKAEYMASEGTGYMPSYSSPGSKDRKQAKKTLSTHPYPSYILQFSTPPSEMNWTRTGSPLYVPAPWPPDSATSQMSVHSWNTCLPGQMHSESTGHSSISLHETLYLLLIFILTDSMPNSEVSFSKYRYNFIWKSTINTRLLGLS